MAAPECPKIHEPFYVSYRCDSYGCGGVMVTMKSGFFFAENLLGPTFLLDETF